MPAQRIHVVAGFFVFMLPSWSSAFPGRLSFSVKKLYISGCRKKSVELH